MAKVISIAIRKGGVGKSTTAVNLASALHLRGKRVLLVDLEHTANATISVGINPYDLKTSIADLFTSIDLPPQQVILRTDYGLSVLPATEKLEQVEAGMTATSIGALKPIIEALKADFDYIIIDTPPGKSFLAIASLVASDGVIIPLEPHYLAMQGLAQIISDIKKVQGINQSLKIIGILPTKVQSNPNITKTILTQIGEDEEYKGLLLPYRIKFTIRNVELSVEGIPLVVSDQNDETAQEYFKLVDTIL